MERLWENTSPPSSTTAVIPSGMRPSRFVSFWLLCFSIKIIYLTYCTCFYWPFTFSFVGWFVGLLVRWLVRWFVGWFVGWLVGSLVGWLVRSFVGSFVGSFILL